MFSEKHWNVNGVKTLLKNDVTGSIDQQPGSGRQRSARTIACISEVEDLILFRNTHWCVDTVVLSVPCCFVSK